jgi:pimeloyl-ACP methyl ester carboxylesterase
MPLRGWRFCRFWNAIGGCPAAIALDETASERIDAGGTRTFTPIFPALAVILLQCIPPVVSTMTVSPDFPGQLPYPSATPAWFRSAIQTEASRHVVVSDALDVQYRCWNAADSQKSPLLFVHGYRGHSRWWDFIAPFFKDRFRVFALDLSCMGDSGHRPRYLASSHRGDIVAVLRAIGSTAAVVIGHSYGGGRTLAACAEEPDLIERAVILDSSVIRPEDQAGNEMRRPRRPAPYPDYDAARARFRLVPSQPAEDYAVEHVARHSLKSVPGGWTWKFGPDLTNEPGVSSVLARVDVPVDIAIGEKSKVINEEGAQRIVAALRRGRGPVVVPEAGHHLMLDQPLTTISVLRALLAPGSKV